MTAAVVTETEGLPASYPAVGYSLSNGAAAIDRAFVWQRIEAWISYRWQERSAVYVIDGPGDWAPRLQPFTLTMSERWQDDAWAAVTLSPSPYGGYALDGGGPYRITGTVGTTEPAPAAVREAYKRLAEYLAGATDADSNAAMIRESDLDYSYERPATWLARAMQMSGAADLLRPWRGLGAR